MELITKKSIKTVIFIALACCVLPLAAQQEPQPRQIEAWITAPDRSALFGQQPEKIPFTDAAGRGGAPIVIDEQRTMQTIDGFGFALTGGSAEHLMKMSRAERAKLIRELFATDGNNIGVTYLRLSIGASDLNSFVFSYNDLMLRIYTMY
jgi:glucosylceramidase